MKFQIRSVFLLLLFTLSAFGAESCRFDLRDRKHPLIQFTRFDLDTDRMFFPRVPIVSVALARKTGDGVIYKFTKEAWAPQWGSNYAPPENNFAVHLNPMWPVFILQKHVADYFGFRRISQNSMLAPDANVLNSRIESINKILIAKELEPIEARFYDGKQAQAEQKKYPSYTEMFVRRFVEKLEFPLVEDELIHDLATHPLNILITKKLMAPQRARGRALLKVVDELRALKNFEGLPEGFKDPEYREVLIRAMLRIFSIEVDNFSGQASWTLGSAMVGDFRTANEKFFRYYEMGLLYLGMNPQNLRPTTLEWVDLFTMGMTSMVENIKPEVKHSWISLLLKEKNKDVLSYWTNHPGEIYQGIKIIVNRSNQQTGFFNQPMVEAGQNQYTGLSSFLARVSQLQWALDSDVIMPLIRPDQLAEW